MANFLEPNSDKLLQNLLLNNDPEGSDLLTAAPSLGNMPQPLHKVVVPKPGFCVKFKTESSGEKVFVNICQADNIPKPKDITDEELLALLDMDDTEDFRIPMSIGAPRAELDKSEHGCTAYDIVINPDFLVRVQNSAVMLGFLLSIVIDGLQVKYDIMLEKKWKILKNKKFIGTLPEQNIRASATPLIQDMSGESPLGKRPLISEVSTDSKTKEATTHKAPAPPYTIIQEPPEGMPEFLVAEMHLPKVKSASSVTVDVGEDRIVLETRSDIYHLDIYLPCYIIQHECAAQYNKNTKILTLTMPVAVS